MAYYCMYLRDGVPEPEALVVDPVSLANPFRDPRAAYRTYLEVLSRYREALAEICRYTIAAATQSNQRFQELHLDHHPGGAS